MTITNEQKENFKGWLRRYEAADARVDAGRYDYCDAQAEDDGISLNAADCEISDLIREYKLTEDDVDALYAEVRAEAKPSNHRPRKFRDVPIGDLFEFPARHGSKFHGKYRKVSPRMFSDGVATFRCAASATVADEPKTDTDFIEINGGPVADMERATCLASVHDNGPAAPFPYFVTVRDKKSPAVMVRGFRDYDRAKAFAEENASELDYDCGPQDFNDDMPFGC